MEQLPEELILQITYYLEPIDITRLNLASKYLLKISRDNELWRRLCFDNSHTEAARKVTRSRIGRLEAGLQKAITRATGCGVNSVQYGSSKGGTTTARAMANWDPTYVGEKVDWYAEYIARHAPLSMSWLEQPQTESNSAREKLEIRGLGLLKERDDDIVVAPLDDGSVCLWNIGHDEGVHGAKDGLIMIRSRPGLLSVDGPNGSKAWQNAHIPSTRLASMDIAQCLSVDSFRKKAYFAVGSGLYEIDISTLQITSYDRYPYLISALSEAAHPIPLTVGTTLSLHLHDPRLGNNGRLSSASAIDDRVQSHSLTDFHRLHSGDVSEEGHAKLQHHGPLTIHHLPYTIYVAGRFPSILSYDRRYFPKLDSNIHSGARVSCITSLPSPGHSTLVAAGEYNGKGSLELYPLSSDTPIEPTRNRTSASRSKLLSLTAHGTRLLFSDSDGQLKWTERDGSTLVRRWNINEYSTTESQNGIFSATINEGDVARKLLSVNEGEKSEVCVWTGERVGVLGFRKGARFGVGAGKDEREGQGDSSPNDGDDSSSDGGESDSANGRDYGHMMRGALERQADEVRFMRGLGLGGNP